MSSRLQASGRVCRDVVANACPKKAQDTFVGHASLATMSHHGTPGCRVEKRRPPSCSLGRIWSARAADRDATFRVLDWNILAPSFAYEQRYNNIAPNLLNWDVRCSAVAQKILEYQPDIITLQEVTEETFHDLHEKLSKQDYEGRFGHKTDEREDGLATFWKRVRFQEVQGKWQRVCFNVGGRLDKPQIALMVLLEDRQYAPERVLVSNTHLIFNTKRGDIKLGQMALMINEIWKFLCLSSTRQPLPERTSVKLSSTLLNVESFGSVERASGTLLKGFPALLMCGDFNLTPQSCLYHWLATGFFDFRGFDDDEGRNCLSGQYLMQQHDSRNFVSTGHNGHGSSSNYDPTVALPQSKLRRRSSVEGNRENAGWFEPLLSSFDASLFLRPHVIWVTASLLPAPLIAVSNREPVPQDSFSSRLTLGPKQSDKNQDFSSSSPQQQQHSCPCTLYHPLLCRSSYATQSFEDDMPNEPAVTAYHGWQKGCIDYIWYSADTLDVYRILEMPSLRALRKLGDIPNKVGVLLDVNHLFTKNM